MMEAFYYYIGELNSPLNSPNLSLKVSDKVYAIYTVLFEGDEKSD